MSCEEHALENAITEMERGGNIDHWAQNDPNLKAVKATPKEIWNMAAYVLYTYKPSLDW